MKLRLAVNSVRRRGEKAFSLAEAMVGMSLMGILFVSLYGGMSSGFALTQVARENLRATQILVQKLEAVRLFTWSQVADTNNYLKFNFGEKYDPLGATNNCGGAQYTGYVRASLPPAGDLPEAYRTNMRTITVTLYWTNYHGGKTIVHQREMQTRVARNGMQNYIWGAL